MFIFFTDLKSLDERVYGLHTSLRVSRHVIGHRVRRPVLLQVGLEPEKLPTSLHETLLIRNKTKPRETIKRRPVSIWDRQCKQMTNIK